MWTSERDDRRTASAFARRFLEAAGLAGVLALAPELLRSWFAVAYVPHPGWFAVVVLAARYGLGGLLSGVLAVASAVALGAAIAGTPLLDAWALFHTVPDLVAFAACVTVAWVAAWHVRRETELEETVASLTERLRCTDETLEALRDVVGALRVRVDRPVASLAFLRNAAERLEGPDPVAAIEGAADLALARTGACAVAIEAAREGFRLPVTLRDARGPGSHEPLVVREAPIRLPLRDGGERIGTIALWGIPPDLLDAATRHDLELVAAWCSDALAGVSERPEPQPMLTGSQ